MKAWAATTRGGFVGRRRRADLKLHGELAAHRSITNLSGSEDPIPYHYGIASGGFFQFWRALRFDVFDQTICADGQLQDKATFRTAWKQGPCALIHLR